MQFLGGDDLNSVLLVGFDIFSSINFTVIALSNDLKESVVVDHFDHGDKKLMVERLV
jgi:hypothetical protein